MSMPKRVLLRVMRRLEEKDAASVAATCKTGMRSARHSAWSTCMRMRNLGRTLNLDREAMDSEPNVSHIARLSAEIIGEIMNLIAPRHLVSLARASRLFRDAFKRHMLGAAYKSMHAVGIPPAQFMEAMLSTSSIIAGSVPANILSGNTFTPADLDVVTPASEEDTMMAILKTYGFTQTDSKTPRGMQGSLRMLYKLTKDDHTIRLWVASSENPTVPIMLTATTFVMNYISPWGIYCAYPRMTLTNRGLLNYFTDEGQDANHEITYRRVMQALNKYTARGVTFEVDDRNWPDLCKKHVCFSSASCTHTARNLYDSAGMHISFPVSYTGYKKYLAENTRLNSKQTTIWSLGGNFCGDPVLFHRAFSRNVALHMKRPENFEEMSYVEDDEVEEDEA
ncbi:hypothetical protein B0H16DRAFT_1717897 [Mycena metata]|uniref:F-box domain-containing protein n=1 Tax=Mycena metata TaxID=1033252 RepID=A0AAD7JI53_9AGAR|nr:hypothetical protein B0H16DRAFT_1740313 [Mycena metata]KAJ7765351.1 hypothetical protein B0H16DRAFT_1717897 [Mycena metata]